MASRTKTTRTRRKGFFISFEGGEGSGKSTQMRHLVQWLKESGLPVSVSKEPGGTEVGEKIREILLDPKNRSLCPETELLLYEADRAQHTKEVLRPTLEAGHIIVSDRFADSSTVYQGICRGLGRKWVESLNTFATGNLLPDLVILLDVPVEMGVERIRRRLKSDVFLGGKPRAVKIDRIEREDRKFHELVRKGFRTLARKHASRFAIFDGTRTETELAQSIQDLVKKKLMRRSLWTGR